MSCLVINTSTFSMSNITDTIETLTDNAAFNVLRDIIDSGQIEGKIYSNATNLGEAQNLAISDGYDIDYSFFMMEDTLELWRRTS